MTASYVALRTLEICLGIESILQASRFHQFQKNLVYRILCTTGFAAEAHSKKQKGSSVPAVQILNLSTTEVL